MAENAQIEKSLAEQTQEALSRLDAGTGLPADYTLVDRLKAAQEQLGKGFPGAAKKDADTEEEAAPEGDAADADADDDAEPDDAGKSSDDGDLETDDDDDDSTDDMGKSLDGADVACPECATQVLKSFNHCPGCGGAVLKSLFDADPLLGDDETDELTKSMSRAAEEAGADDGAAYVDAEPVLKSIGASLDTILGELRAGRKLSQQLLARVERVEKSLRAGSGGPGAPGAQAPGEVPAPDAHTVVGTAVKKGLDASAALELRNLVTMMEGRMEEMAKAISQVPVSPHPRGRQSAAPAATLGAAVHPAVLEEMALGALEKALNANLITVDQAAHAAETIGTRRDKSPEEIIQRLAPEATPMLKSLLAARS